MRGASNEARPASCLVVDDDARLRAVLVEALSELGFSVRQAASVEDTLSAFAAGMPDLLLLDVALPDGRAADVLDAVGERSPAPRIIALSGTAGPDESFELATRGVRLYLKKPINLAELERAVQVALSEPPDLVPHVRSAVGLIPIQDVEEKVRATMVDEALARGKGSRRAAARALGISRQLLQHILRKG